MCITFHRLETHTGVQYCKTEAHLAGCVGDCALVKSRGNAGVGQALQDNLLKLVALVGHEDHAAAAEPGGDALHQPLGKVQRVGDADHCQPRSFARWPLAQVVEHLQEIKLIDNKGMREYAVTGEGNMSLVVVWNAQ